MNLLAQTCEAVTSARRKSEKVALVAGYLRSRTLEEAAVSAIFLSGRPFPAHEESTLQVGGSLLWRQVAKLSGRSDAELTAAYRRHGDLGSAAQDALEGRAPATPTLNVVEVERRFRQIAQTRSPAAKADLLRELMARATALEAKYLVKIISGEMRIGLKESLVEEAIAKAYDLALADVQRATMLLGDIGETLRLAHAGRLQEARMRMFRPIGFMLASPIESAQQAFDYLKRANLHRAQVEDKYDGIRAQAHVAGGQVRLFSRTLDDVTESFPELIDALAGFREAVILDGEVVAWRQGRALPFSELQKRLGRKRVSDRLLYQVPVAYVVFDVLYAGGELVIDQSLGMRGEILDRLFQEAQWHEIVRTRDAQGKLALEPAIESPAFSTTAADGRSQVIRARVLLVESARQLTELFDAARDRGNEGLMIKDLNSAYTPGRRGRSWLKLKRELATLDVVVTAVEFGHGKRARVLSDYTFSVRDGERLLAVGKAYSGLTDAEIAGITEWFLGHTLVDHGFWREVEPAIVLEVAFNAVMKSGRHESGFALRFPRILRLRPDKSPAEIDTLDRVREIFEQQATGMLPHAGLAD